MRAAKIGVAFFFVVALLLIIPFPPLSLPRLPNHARRQPHGPIGAGEHYARRVAGLVDLYGRAAVGLQRLDGVSGPANDPADARPGDEEHEGALRRAGSWRRRGKGWIMLMEDSGVLLVVLRRRGREEGLWQKPQEGRAFVQHNEQPKKITDCEEGAKVSTKKGAFVSSRCAFARGKRRPIGAATLSGVRKQGIESVEALS